jgi:hypothetical protein
MILFKKGLQSQELKNFLRTKQHTTLEGLVDAARAMNPRANSAELNSKKSPNTNSSGVPNAAKPHKQAPSSAEKKPEVSRCSSTHCSEQGHMRDKCWRLHPELQPAWMKNKKNNAVATVAEQPDSSSDRLLEMMATLQADMEKIKSDLN